MGIDRKLADTVNAWKDEPAKTLGPGHRRVRHDILSNALIAVVLGDPKAFLAGELHDALDTTISKLPRKTRAIIDLLAD